jgi:hypothetical protein
MEEAQEKREQRRHELGQAHVTTAKRASAMGDGGGSEAARETFDEDDTWSASRGGSGNEELEEMPAAVPRGGRSRDRMEIMEHEGVDASAMGGDARQGWMRARNELPEIAAPFGLLPQQLVAALVQGAHERVVRNEQTGELEPILRADDLARLAATCRYFRSFIEELAQDCIRARESAREPGREKDGQRVVRRVGETWLQMLQQLDWYDRVPLEPKGSFMRTFVDNDPAGGGLQLGIGEVRASGGAGPLTAATGFQHSTRQPLRNKLLHLRVARLQARLRRRLPSRCCGGPLRCL